MVRGKGESRIIENRISEGSLSHGQSGKKSIVVAFDSFKGSLSAPELCAAVRRGIMKGYPQADVIELPLADGGEGTMMNLVRSTQGSIRQVETTDPLGRPMNASFGVLGDGKTAVVEWAQASGLHLVSPHERNPLLTTSFGTGELIKAALDEGYRRFIVGLGGSATNDGGTGMLRALGMRFLDAEGCTLPDGGGYLAQLQQIDDTSFDERLREATFIIASDVTNPLCGIHGASAVFGPQKGATPEMIVKLDSALQTFAQAINSQFGKDIASLEGSGAAGGAGAALMAFMHATMQSGIELVMDAVRFEDHLLHAALVLTGEGRLDEQTLSGKAVAGVCRRALHHGIPVIGICGSVQLSGEQMSELGLLGAFSIVPGPCDLASALDQAAVWIEDRAEQITRIFFREIDRHLS